MTRFALLTVLLALVLTACGPETEPEENTVPKNTREQGAPRQDAPN